MYLLFPKQPGSLWVSLPRGWAVSVRIACLPTLAAPCSDPAQAQLGDSSQQPNGSCCQGQFGKWHEARHGGQDGLGCRGGRVLAGCGSTGTICSGINPEQPGWFGARQLIDPWLQPKFCAICTKEASTSHSSFGRKLCPDPPKVQSDTLKAEWASAQTIFTLILKKLGGRSDPMKGQDEWLWDSKHLIRVCWEQETESTTAFPLAIRHVRVQRLQSMFW